jgi:catechol 2,3-dioxygenase-like lactoylglutathione lyase family enzyme
MGSSPGDRPDPFLGIQAVNIFVRNQDRSLQFYIGQLGFRLAYDARLQSGERWVAVAPPDGSTMLSLIAPHPHSKQYKLIGRATQVVFITEDFAAKFREWSDRGVRFQTPRLRRVKYETPPSGAQPTVWGGTSTRFQDVDRNSFALVSFDAVSLLLRRDDSLDRLEFRERPRDSSGPARVNLISCNCLLKTG